MHVPEITGYTLFDQIGEGGTATVWRGKRNGEDRDLAIKIVSPGHMDPSMLDRALQEGRVCWSINHPNVVRVLSMGRGAHGVHLVMEYLIGETLAERIFGHGRLNSGATLRIARQVARGLSAIHHRGAVHRDIKPENIFLTQAAVDDVKLLDLGIAHLAESDPDRRVKTKAGAVFGTPAYMAPELLLGKAVDARTDIYALGATMYHCLAGGMSHFDGDWRDAAQAVLRGQLPPRLPDDVPAAVSKLVFDCMAFDAAARPKSVTDFLSRLGTLRGEQPKRSPTTVMLNSETVTLGDLQVPRLGDWVDHQRFRDHLLIAVAILFRAGELPPGVREALTQSDTAETVLKSAITQAELKMREAGHAAMDSAQRIADLEEQRAQIALERQQLRNNYVRQTTRLLQIAGRIEDQDAQYARYYHALETTQATVAAQARSQNAQPSLSALFGQQVSTTLDKLDMVQENRFGLTQQQEVLRSELRELKHTLSELNRRKAEIDSRLGEIKYVGQIDLTEEDARAAEDEVSRAERAREHAYLLLGLAIHRGLLDS